MKIKNIGIGYIPEVAVHCFILDIQRDNIKVYETFDNGQNKTLKAEITKDNWNIIKPFILDNFKSFLKDNNYKLNRLKQGENYINRLLGKELIFLLWGIETTTKEVEILTALKNWQGLSSEERWYFYTMTNANLSIEHNKGWRGAVKKILIEN